VRPMCEGDRLRNDQIRQFVTVTVRVNL